MEEFLQKSGEAGVLVTEEFNSASLNEIRQNNKRPKNIRVIFMENVIEHEA